MTSKSRATGELLFAFAAAIVHITVELFADGLRGAADDMGRPQHFVIAVAGIVLLSYLVARAVRYPALLAEWGFRGYGFPGSLWLCLLFAVLTSPLLFWYGIVRGHWPLPDTFWMVAFLYPLYGLGQQFILQVMVNRNLRFFVPAGGRRAVLAGTLFSLSHFPNVPIMILTFPVGVVFAMIYNRHRNLWALGLAHGILGALAYYLVLGKDPGAKLIALFT